MAQVTITQNTADSDNDGIGNGGGVYNGSPILILDHGIVAENYDTPNNLCTSLKHPDISGPIHSDDGYNLIGNTTGATFSGSTSHDLIGVNPLLGPLAYNGGPTFTHALLPGSPAIDAVDSCSPRSSDWGPPSKTATATAWP